MALRAVTGDLKLSIGTMHGKAGEFKHGGSSYVLFSLYHPASIIYNRSLKEVYIDDIQELKKHLKLSKKI